MRWNASWNDEIGTKARIKNAAERCQNVAYSKSCGFPATQTGKPGRGDRLHRLLPSHPGLVHFSNPAPRLTPWATFCRASGAKHRSLVVRRALRPPSPGNWKVAVAGIPSCVTAAKRLGVRAACRRLSATPRRFKPKRQLSPASGQSGSFAPLRSRTPRRWRALRHPFRPGSPSPDGRVRPR